MRNTYRRSSLYGLLFPITVLLLLFGAASVTGYALWRANFGQGVAERIIRIPASRKSLSPFSAVTQQDLREPATNEMAFIPLTPRDAQGKRVVWTDDSGARLESKVRGVVWSEKEGDWAFTDVEGQTFTMARVQILGNALMNPGKIVGRVLARERPANTVFTESHFLPEGTQAGISAGIPPGMHGLTIDAAKVKGIHAFKLGEKLDLMASVPEEMLSDFEPIQGARSEYFVSKTATRREDSVKTAISRLIASGVVVVQPPRAKPGIEKKGTKSNVEPREEIVLAIAASDLGFVNMAVERSVPLSALAQTSRPVERSEAKPSSMVEVVKVARPIVAFSAVSEMDFVDPQTRRQDIDFIEPDAARQGKIVPYSLLKGRVVKRNISRGEILSEEDLLPIGTRPGVGAGLTPDRHAITLDASKLRGAELLSVGDRIDILGSFPLKGTEEKTKERITQGGVTEERESVKLVRPETQMTRADSLGRRADSWRLALDAVVVREVSGVPGSASGASGSNSATVSSITVAVFPRDAESLVQAMSRDDIVLGVTIHSSLPEHVLPEGVPEGYLRAPVCCERLQAFREISSFGVSIRRPLWRYVPNDEASKGLVQELSSFAHRVLKNNKEPGELFYESDFLPEGARPGVAANVPAGTRAVYVSRDSVNLELGSGEAGSLKIDRKNHDRIKGLELLEPGQFVSIHAARPLPAISGPEGASYAGRATVDVVADRALVIQTYQDPGADAVVAAVVACPEDAASKFGEALLSAAEIRFFAAPSAPSDSAQASPIAATPKDFDPLGSATMIERVVGKNRSTHVFPGSR